MKNIFCMICGEKLTKQNGKYECSVCQKQLDAEIVENVYWDYVNKCTPIKKDVNEIMADLSQKIISTLTTLSKLITASSLPTSTYPSGLCAERLTLAKSDITANMYFIEELFTI